MKVLILAHYSPLGAPSRYRFYQYFPYFREGDIHPHVNVLQDERMLRWIFAGRRWKAYLLLPIMYLRRAMLLLCSSRYDLILVEKECFPYAPAWVDLLLGLGRTPYIIDLDDAVFHKYELSPSPVIRFCLGGKIRTLMRRAAAVVAGNGYIAAYAGRAGCANVVEFPSVVDMARYGVDRVYESRGRPVIGWIGTTSNSRHLKVAGEALAAIAERRDFLLRIVGGWEVELPDNIQQEYLPWVEEEEVERISGFDIGIMPLIDGPWERGKCGLKLIQYMAAGVPVVASPVGANRSIVADGVNGFLAGSTDQWIDRLELLLGDGELRERLGREGRKRAMERYSLELYGPRFSRLIAEAVSPRGWGDPLPFHSPTASRRLPDRESGGAVSNLSEETVRGFGDEWRRFDQSTLSPRELREMFDQYFGIFPFATIGSHARGFDLGCGSGRWATIFAPMVAELHCIDASEQALEVARRNLAGRDNCTFHLASVDAMPLADGSMDFGYSIGVLHHLPDTAAGIRSCAAKLKPGAPLLLYIYYAFDNRPPWFVMLWRISEIFRLAISRFPFAVRYWVSQLIALAVYYPLARASLVLERWGANVERFPLSAYRTRSLYSMRTDALDRFGTRLERRFTAARIRTMMEEAGLEKIEFSRGVPYWCVLGYRKDYP